jgi:hypothetical protein
VRRARQEPVRDGRSPVRVHTWQSRSPRSSPWSWKDRHGCAEPAPRAPCRRQQRRDQRPFPIRPIACAGPRSGAHSRAGCPLSKPSDPPSSRAKDRGESGRRRSLNLLQRLRAQGSEMRAAEHFADHGRFTCTPLLAGAGRDRSWRNRAATPPALTERFRGRPGISSVPSLRLKRLEALA